MFLLVGSIHPGQGGAILAHGTTAAGLEIRVKADPFVEHNVVTAEILEIAPGAPAVTRRGIMRLLLRTGWCRRVR